MGGGGPTTARGVDGVEGEDGEEGSVNSSESYMPAPKKVNHKSTSSWCRRLLKTLPQTQRGAQNARTSTRVLRSVKSKESTQGGSESEDEH
jgi:hypothetical protein